MIEIEGLSREWADFSLKEINLTVEDGEYFVVLGPSGAGKSLLLETIAGFYTPNRGRITLNGTDITDLPPEKRGIAMVYQDYMLFPNMTVRENIAYGLRRRHMEEKEIKRETERAAKLLGITEILERNPLTLSGGEQQRVALARAMVVRPALLLLDEPTGSLDATLQREMRRELLSLHKELGGMVIHITHSRDEAISMAHRIAIMFGGKIEQAGTPSEIFRRPRSRRLADFVGVENILEGTIISGAGGTMVDTGRLKIVVAGQIEHGKKVLASVRPEEIMLSKEPLKSSARNCIAGKITGMQDMASFTEITVDAGAPILVHITRQALMEMEITVGSDVYLSFKATSVNVIER